MRRERVAAGVSTAPQGRARDLPALVAAGITVCFWASAFVGIRSAGRSFSPGALSLGRLLVALVVLALISLARGERPPSRRDLRAVLPTLLACGIAWFGVYNLMLNSGERRVDAGTAAMLVNVGPVLIALLAGLFLHEGLPRNLLLGCAVAFAGATTIAFANTLAGTTEGVLLCLGAAGAYAIGAVTQKVVLRRLSALQTIFACCLIGVVFFLPWAPELVDEARAAPAGALGWTLYLGAFPTAVGFATWAFALRRTAVGRLGAVTYLVPPLSLLLSWAWLGQTPAALAYPGGLLCLIGVALTRAHPRRLRPTRRAATGELAELTTEPLA